MCIPTFTTLNSTNDEVGPLYGGLKDDDTIYSSTGLKTVGTLEWDVIIKNKRLDTLRILFGGK